MHKIYILHGWAIDPNNQGKWQPFMDLLKKKKIKVEFLQIPGLDKPLKKPWSLTNYVQWLSNQLPQNKKVILLGHSFGGQLAIRFAATYPEKVKQLILIGSSGIIDRSLNKRLKRSIFRSITKVGKIVTNSPFLRKSLYKLTREQDYYQASHIMRQTMQNVLKDEILDNLPNIDCPTQIIWGQNDTTTPLKHAYVLKNSIKNSKLQLIKHARHSPQFTHPEEVVKVIESHLEK